MVQPWLILQLRVRCLRVSRSEQDSNKVDLENPGKLSAAPRNFHMTSYEILRTPETTLLGIRRPGQGTFPDEQSDAGRQDDSCLPRVVRVVWATPDAKKTQTASGDRAGPTPSSFGTTEAGKRDRQPLAIHTLHGCRCDVLQAKAIKAIHSLHGCRDVRLRRSRRYNFPHSTCSTCP